MNSRILLLILSLLLGPALLGACGGSSTDEPPPPPVSDLPVAATAEAKAQGYSTAKADTIVFIFDQATQQAMLDKAGVTDIKALEVRGSFNGWKNTGLTFTHSSSEPGIWFLEKPLADVNVPGNSGQPEFKFVVSRVVVDGVEQSPDKWLDVDPLTPAGYSFSGNHIVVFPGDNVETIIANKVQADTLKTVADFDLETDAGKAELSNFRQVGALKLFRSYHPFKKSRPEMDTEAPRINLVNQLMQEQGVQSVITLSGEEAADAAGESIDPYLQTLMDNGHNLYLDVGYNLVYFESNTPAFGELIQQVATFMLDPQHEAPFLVHCRLGTDRTGVVSATLAALAGMSWQDIAADYQLSNRMGMHEFRDYKILQYSFEHMLQIPRGTVGTVDLQQKMRSYFIDNGYLTGQQIDALVLRLS